MAEKDLSEKSLEGFNEVFADIVNVLLFDGKEIVKPEELEDALPNSILKIDGKVHTQERDVAKYWKNGQIRLSYIGFENQSGVDKFMPLRILSYDGAVYKKQLTDFEAELKLARKENRKPKEFKFYPVTTLVLYFGERHWSKYRELTECIDIKEELKPFVNNYKINVVEMCYLTRAQVDMFKSDFKIVADYFWQIHNNKDYNPPAETIVHVQEILTLLKVFSKNIDLHNLKNANNQSGGNEMFEEFWENKFKSLREEGANKKADEDAIALLKDGDSIEKVARCINIPLEHVKELAAQLNK